MSNDYLSLSTPVLNSRDQHEKMAYTSQNTPYKNYTCEKLTEMHF